MSEQEPKMSNGVKKIIVIGVIIIFLGLVGYIFVIKKPANREPLQPVSQKQTETPSQPSPTISIDTTEVPSQPSPTISIDTNDNLDQALQDLDQVE